jgi:Flp pilus assembly protein CpaB
VAIKRNMVPLLGIAFVVAIISTGVFYGLFAGKLRSSSAELAGQPILVASRDLERGTVLQAGDLSVSQLKGSLSGSYSKPDELVGATLLASVKHSEPLLEERVAPRAASGGSAGAVPAGMRAVSIRVSESDGLLALLRAGAKVDVQAVLERNGSAELKTILQNVELLSVNPSAQGGSGGRAAHVVTVLTRAQDIDVIALADSGARIRVALRNPLDNETLPRQSMGLTSVFQSRGSKSKVMAQAVPKNSAASESSAAAPDSSMQLHVQVLSASAAAVNQLASQFAVANASGRMQVFRSGSEAERLVQQLVNKREVEVVSSRWLAAGAGHRISFHADSTDSRFRVRFRPVSYASGTVTVEIRPEVDGVGDMDKYDAEFKDGASFLLKGILGQAGDHKTLDQLFPGHGWENRALLMVVSAQLSKPSVATAVAQARRGQ